MYQAFQPYRRLDAPQWAAAEIPPLRNQTEGLLGATIVQPEAVSADGTGALSIRFIRQRQNAWRSTRFSDGLPSSTDSVWDRLAFSRERDRQSEGAKFFI